MATERWFAVHKSKKVMPKRALATVLETGPFFLAILKVMYCLEKWLIR